MLNHLPFVLDFYHHGSMFCCKSAMKPFKLYHSTAG